MSKFFVASVLAMSLSLKISAQTALADELKIVNIMPTFEKAWQLGLGKPLDTRIKLLKQLVFIPNRPAFDDYGFLSFDDVNLSWYVAEVAPIMPQKEHIAHSYIKTFQLRHESFGRRFRILSRPKLSTSCRRFSFSTARRTTQAFASV